MSVYPFIYRLRYSARSFARAVAVAVVLSLSGMCAALFAQADLLPLDHPATTVLERLYYSGAVPDIPVEHFPISRKAALEFLQSGVASVSIPESLRRQAVYFVRELAADKGESPRAVVIPTSDNSLLFFDDPFGDRPFTGLHYTDTATDSYLVIDPVLDAEFRYDADLSANAAVLQGGARLRGTVLDHVGFSAQATNGTILGNDTVVLADPRFGQSFKFGVVRQNRDIDFGSGHVRVGFDQVAAGIGREPVRLGAGEERSLLLGAGLPSNYDYLRFQMRLGRFSFTHIHASILSDATGPAAGIAAEIPQKYVAAHLFSVGPFGGVRASIGEAVVYGGRGFEIGYLNPLNFLKSQEHFLRDRDNSYMYATLGVNAFPGLFFEGEFMLDDLLFSRIGEGYWGNKTAWRLGARATGWPFGIADADVSYTRLEPYVYSHFNPLNAYTHDGAMLAASGLEPNSHQFDLGVNLYPLPNLSVRVNAEFGEHGANVEQDGEVVRNVGGDVRRTFDTLSNETVEFLDGTLETMSGYGAKVEYEFLRNMYVRAQLLGRSISVNDQEIESTTQIWFGVRIGSR